MLVAKNPLWQSASLYYFSPCPCRAQGTLNCKQQEYKQKPSAKCLHSNTKLHATFLLLEAVVNTKGSLTILCADGLSLAMLLTEMTSSWDIHTHIYIMHLTHTYSHLQITNRKSYNYNYTPIWLKYKCYILYDTCYYNRFLLHVFLIWLLICRQMHTDLNTADTK